MYQSGYNIVILNEDGKKVDGIKLTLSNNPTESIETVENMPETGDGSVIGGYMVMLVIVEAELV